MAGSQERTNDVNDHTTNEPTVKLCECGCGQPTSIAKSDSKERSHIKGQPVRFLPGHNPKRVILSLADRFWPKVAVGNPDECWMWTATLTPSGYGQLRDAEGKKVNAHRISYILHYGPVPDDCDVCHSCDANCPPGDISYRRCVNPAHLWAGTRSENIQDMHRKGRQSRLDRRGAQGANTKLKESDVLQIRALHAQGLAPIEIARQFNITNSHVVGIVKRRTWSHI